MGRVVPPSPLPLSLFLDFPPTLCDKNQKLPKNHQKFAYLKKNPYLCRGKICIQ